MRIVAGSRKGARIFAPKGLDTRPTGDRVREAAFNLIGPVHGATVLVEASREACRAIDRNLERLRLTGAVVLCQDAARALAAEAQAARRYDLVLVDPPYDHLPIVQPILARYLPAVLAGDGVAVVETAARDEPELPLAKRTSRRYGAARLTLFEHPTA